MKIGILTFHEVVNPGAFFQALGSQRLLESMGHEAWIIDYTAPAHRFTTSGFIRKHHIRMLYRWRMLLDMRAKDHAFRRAHEKHFHLTRRFVDRAQIGQEAFDAILVGADIVWNYKMPELGRDPVYFGEGVGSTKLISFAASCGDCSPSEPVPEYVSEGLSRFSAISVRDENSATIVKTASSRDSTVLCDPAFHLPLTGFSPPSPEKPYVLVYLIPKLHSKELQQQVSEYARKNGLWIISCYHRHYWADEMRMEIEPDEWLRLIAGASLVVTNTFHGSIFSIRLHSNFIIEYNPAIQMKTEGMIKRMGLETRVFSVGSSVETLASSEINYSAADEFMARESDKARNWLAEALEASIK